jgi:hypothetical protein
VDFVLIALHDNLRHITWKVTTPEECGELSTRIGGEIGVHVQAMNKAEALWNASATMPIGKFPRSKLAARRVEIVGRYTDLRAAETCRVQLEDRARKRASQQNARSSWRYRLLKKTKEEKAEERLMEKRQAVLEQSASKLLALKVDELLQNALLAEEQKKQKLKRTSTIASHGALVPAEEPAGTNVATFNPSVEAAPAEDEPREPVPKAWDIVL